MLSYGRFEAELKKWLYVVEKVHHNSPAYTIEVVTGLNRDLLSEKYDFSNFFSG